MCEWCLEYYFAYGLIGIFCKWSFTVDAWIHQVRHPPFTLPKCWIGQLRGPPFTLAKPWISRLRDPPFTQPKPWIRQVRYPPFTLAKPWKGFMVRSSTSSEGSFSSLNFETCHKVQSHYAMRWLWFFLQLSDQAIISHSLSLSLVLAGPKAQCRCLFLCCNVMNKFCFTCFFTWILLIKMVTLHDAKIVLNKHVSNNRCTCCCR
jgi:hypothetical protein